MRNLSSRTSRRAGAFTLVEILISVSIMAVVMTILAELMMRTQDTVSQASKQANEFQEARRALETIQSRLSQARMDAIWSYRYTSATATDIKGYERSSDQHFVLDSVGELLPGVSSMVSGQAVFFQAPIGATDTDETQLMQHLLNCVGFYVDYGSDIDRRPELLRGQKSLDLNPERLRFRLMQYIQPAENSILYSDSEQLGLNRLNSREQGLRWFREDVKEQSRPLANNILGLVLVPQMIEESGQLVADQNYCHDSRGFQWQGGDSEYDELRRHQLPAMVTVVIVAADEASYQELCQKRGDAGAATAVQKAFSGRFVKHEYFESDLKAVESALSAMKLHHRTMSTTVALRGSKWIAKNTENQK